LAKFSNRIRKAAILLFLIAGVFTLADEMAQAKIAGNNGVSHRIAVLLNRVSAHFHRPVTIISGCRSYAHNRRIGGARESYHLRCMAADFRVPGVGLGQVYRYAASLPGRGGVGTYCHESFMHIDVGPRREWHWSCGGRKHHKKLRKHHNRHHRKHHGR
jgi:Peptidase M15